MSFLARLFGKKPQPKQKVVENKTVNLETLSLDALVNVIQSGSDDQVRFAAIQKINDQTALLSLAGLHGIPSASPAIQKAARQRIAQLVDSGDLDGNQLIQAIQDKNALFSILGLINNTALFEQVFADITDETLLASFAVDGSSSKVRQRAAEKITDKDTLQQLLKNTKTKDKTVFKIVKEKCDAFKEEEKRHAEIVAAVAAVVQSLEQQSNRPYDAQFNAKFSYITQQWEAKKADASPELVTRAEDAIAKGLKTIASISAEQAELENSRKAAESADLERQTILGKLHPLFEALVNGQVSAESASAQINDLSTAWANVAAVKKPAQSEQKTLDVWRRAIADELAAQSTHGTLVEHKARFEQALAETAADCDAVYQSLKKRVKVLSGSFGNNIPEVINTAKSAYEQWEKTIADKAAALQNSQRQIGGLIRKANELIAAGVLGKAAGIRRTIDEKLQNLEQLPNYLANQLEQLDETLDKLQDWKNYAVLPKKHELVAQLEALDGSKEHPETLALKIRRIQDEWKSLSKGGRDQDQDLWEKFHELAQKVYQPCRDYFAEQAAIRKNNLQNCKQLVVQLQDYLEKYNWEQANWKDVEKVVRVARQEWRSFIPTERAATQPVLADFETVLSHIQQKLNDEFARNVDKKKELINEVKKLAEADDARKAIEGVKQLQIRWQAIGASARKTEQQLWREFRDGCDAVFAKRQQQSVEFKAELEATLLVAKNLIAELDGLVALSGQELTDARKRVDEIRQEFGGLGQFPKNHVTEIKTAFTQAVEQFEEKIKNERVALKQQVWINLFTANDAVRVFELALVKGKSPSIDTVQAQIDAVSQWPNGGLKAIQQKIAAVHSGVDIKANVAALRELCIRAEILTDTVTPAEDQPLRMSFQVNQLQQNFGRKAQDIAAEFEHLIFDWLAVGAVETADYEALFARFNTCRVKASRQLV